MATETGPDRVLRFGNHVLDPDRGELRTEGVVVPVEPQVFDLIRALAERAGRVVSRDEILDVVWQGRIVSESAISSRVNAARQALGDDGTAQRVIRTVARRGYLFVPKLDAAAPAGPALPGKPSIAVLPFEDMSDGAAWRYFADGLTDDILTELTRYDELFVIARQSVFAYRDRSVPLARIASELGVRYVLEGSVWRDESHLRITVRLVDPRDGRAMWSDRYVRRLGDVFAIQDQIIGTIVNTLVGQIHRQTCCRPRDAGPGGADAYDHVLRAMELCWRMTPGTIRAARAEAVAAIAIAPTLARAHALLAWTHVSDGSNLWSDDTAASFAAARTAALRAVAEDDREPWAHLALGWAHLWADHAHDRGLAALAHALTLNPGNAHFRSMLAWGLGWSGRPEAALAELDVAMRLNPLCPPVYLTFLGRALFHLRRFDEALVPLERTLATMPDHANALALVAACQQAAGQHADAVRTVRQVRASAPRFGLWFVREVLPFARMSDRDLTAEMLSRAGLPD